MTSASIFGHGTFLQIGDGAVSEMFTTIAEVMNIDGPNLQQETVEVTSHDSTDRWREFIGGLKDGGEISFGLNFLPADATQSAGAGLIKDLYDSTKRNFQLVFPFSSAVTWSFAAFVTEYAPTSPVDAQLTAECTLKITGAPVLT